MYAIRSYYEVLALEQVLPGGVELVLHAHALGHVGQGDRDAALAEGIARVADPLGPRDDRALRYGRRGGRYAVGRYGGRRERRGDRPELGDA